MVSIVQYRSLVRAFFAPLVLMFILSGCAITLISSYDENTDKAVTQLHKDLEGFFITVEGQAGSASCSYENHKPFYKESKIAINSIALRAEVIPKNEQTVKMVDALKNSLSSLEQLHKLGCFKASQVKSLRSSFNSSFSAILKLELAKKRGE